MTVDYGFKDTNDFLLSLNTDITLPTKTRDIYLYLPFRMLNIYPTVQVFSNMDLMSGKKSKKPFFYMSRTITQTDEQIRLSNYVSINKKSLTLNIANKTVPIKRFIKTYYDKENKLQKASQTIDENASLNVLYLSTYNIFLVIDEQVFNSLYIQLMILEEYDETLFEQVILSPHAKVYKLRI